MINFIRLRSLMLLLLLVSFLLAPLCALATNENAMYYKGEMSTQSRPQVKALDDGLYIGFELGYDSYRSPVNINASINGDTVSANPVINSSGFVGGIFAGYGHYFKNILYLAGETYVNGSGAYASYSFNDGISRSTYNSQISAGTSFGGALLPGIKINDSSLFYLRLGSTWANVENKESASSGGNSATVDTKTWTHGIAYGLGLETAIYKALSLRTEFTHTDYNNSSYSSFGTFFSPADNQVMVGLIYHVNT